MGFTNFGNFGKKVSEFNAQRREKNMEQLRVKSQKAENENKSLEEEQMLRKSIEKHSELKKQVREQKLVKVKGAIEGFNKLGNKFENKSKGNKFDILGNNSSNNKKPELFGNHSQNKPKKVKSKPGKTVKIKIE